MRVKRYQKQSILSSDLVINTLPAPGVTVEARVDWASQAADKGMALIPHAESAHHQRPSIVLVTPAQVRQY